jgi:hypothetical protein
MGIYRHREGSLRSGSRDLAEMDDAPGRSIVIARLMDFFIDNLIDARNWSRCKSEMVLALLRRVVSVGIG